MIDKNKNDKEDNLGKLLKALSRPRGVQDHPNWEAFAEKPFPGMLSFHYTNQDGEEAYFENIAVIKLDLKRLQLMGEGYHGDPLRFDIRKITQARNATTGKRVQELFIDLVTMWKETVHD